MRGNNADDLDAVGNHFGAIADIQGSVRTLSLPQVTQTKVVTVLRGTYCWEALGGQGLTSWWGPGGRVSLDVSHGGLNFCLWRGWAKHSPHRNGMVHPVHCLTGGDKALYGGGGGG